MSIHTPIAVFAGTRADLAPLSSVIDSLVSRAPGHVHIFCGVSLAKERLVAGLDSEGVSVTESQICQLGPLVEDTSPEGLARYCAQLSENVTHSLTQLGIKTLVVLGDRWELLAVVPPAYLLNVRIVHLHGGEVTHGAIDDRVRHSVSKLADVHCTATDAATNRLIQLGEPKNRVKQTGAPGLDRYVDASPLSDEERFRVLPRNAQNPIALFTYHPPTACDELSVYDCAKGALVATAEACGHVLVTHPGPDTGQECVFQAIKEAVHELDNITVVQALGGGFPSWLKTVDLMVGNSSAGMIESGVVGLPVVNIGQRQEGRECGENVIHCSEGYNSVTAAINLALQTTPKDSNCSPYGSGRSSIGIAEVVLQGDAYSRSKVFVDQKGIE